MSKRAPLLTAEKITLLLSIIPYLVDHGPTPVLKLAEDFGVEPELLRSLLRFLGTAGIPGDTATYQHEDLFDIDWDALEERDEAVLTRTVVVDDVPRFSPRETSALIAGLQLLRGMPHLMDGSEVETLTRKLTGVSASATPRLEVSPRPTPALVEVARDALANGQGVSFQYRDVDGNVSRRLVQPTLIEAVNNVWYLHGWCHERRAERVFRVDRMSNFELTPPVDDAPAERAGKPATSPRFAINPEESVVVDVRVRSGQLAALRAFDFTPDKISTAESQAISMDDADVTGRVMLAVADRAPQVIKAAPGAVEVLGPESARAKVYDWASRALAQYDM